MNILTYKIITDEEEARGIWDIFSPHKTIDDEWNFRSVFGKQLHLPLHFIVGYDQDKPVGLLPLQLNTGTGLDPKYLQMNEPFLEFFGGIDTDDNRVFLLPGYENFSPDFLQQIKIPAVLTDLAEAYRVHDREAEHSTDRFELNLTKISSFKIFLQSHFSGKSRGNILNKINYMNKNHKIEVVADSANDVELLFKFSIGKFGEASSFTMAYRRQIYKDLLALYDVDLFTVLVDGEKKAVAFCIIFNGTYTLLNIGYDHRLRDIGKLLVAAQIDRAIERGCSKYDAGKGDNGWKERYHLTKIPQYKLVLNYQTT